MLHLKKQVFLAISFILITATGIFISCNDNGITEDEYQIQYYRTAQLKNIYTNGISVLTENFISKITNLKKNTISFKQNYSLENLTRIQDNWKNTMLVWKELEVYNLGEIEDSFIHFEINRWETNTRLIDEYINSLDIINETYIESKGSSSKGLSALEYLLFSSEDNQIVLNTFTSSSNKLRRFEYLLALIENLDRKANQLKTLWVNNKDSFITSLENGISGSQSQITNAMVSILEEIIISKLGKPLGEQTGGITNINYLESYRSGFSLSIISKYLQAVEKCFTGNFKQNSIKWGYDNYLELIGKTDLTKKINDAILDCKLKIEGINNPLRIELLTNKEKITELRSSFTNLLVLVKVDLANAIGTTITISDNDGD